MFIFLIALQPVTLELLWTAPELLRMKRALVKGSQKGDVFGLGIIIQEIITRTMPYEMHNLDPAGILTFNIVQLAINYRKIIFIIV